MTYLADFGDKDLFRFFMTIAVRIKNKGPKSYKIKEWLILIQVWAEPERRPIDTL